jgi:eukaryotic-like serine/threonine-protein kinase
MSVSRNGCLGRPACGQDVRVRLFRSRRPDGEPPQTGVPESAADIDPVGASAPVEPSHRGNEELGAPPTGREAESRGEAGREPRGRARWGFEEGAAIAEGRTVLRGIGGGNRYEVYLVWDELLFSICVAKILRPDQADDERALRDLALEAEMLEGVAHPVIVRGFDAVLDGPYPHVMIEHLEGPSLRHLIRRSGPLELAQLLPLALHVAGAIQYLARKGLVHLDVKPDNIIMGIPPRLIDMSIARSLERAARTTGAIGTDAYMAPEQCGTKELEGGMGSPSDVWGLGATLYHCVAGAVPFPRDRHARNADDPAIRFPQLVEAPEPLPPRVPQELRELIFATLRPAPDRRPSAAEVADRLEPLVSALPSRMILAPRGGARFR